MQNILSDAECSSRSDGPGDSLQMSHRSRSHREGLGRSQRDSRLGVFAVLERVAVAVAMRGRDSVVVVVGSPLGQRGRSGVMETKRLSCGGNEKVAAHLEEEQQHGHN
jgi:hypothetical protein